MTTIPAITLYQPWASLVSIGAKPFEFRGWPAPARLIGKRVGIHAGARAMKRNELLGLNEKLRGPDWRETGLDRDLAGRLAALPSFATANGDAH